MNKCGIKSVSWEHFISAVRTRDAETHRDDARCHMLCVTVTRSITPVSRVFRGGFELVSDALASVSATFLAQAVIFYS